jgi:hypothetical protein
MDRKELERQIAYWRKCADDTILRDAGLVAFGIYIGLRYARDMLDDKAD